MVQTYNLGVYHGGILAVNPLRDFYILRSAYYLISVQENFKSAITDVIPVLPEPTDFVELIYLLRFGYFYCYCLVIV